VEDCVPRLSIEGSLGIAAGVVLFILDKMGIGGRLLYIVLFLFAAGLCIDSVVRSEWTISKAKKRLAGGIVSVCCLVFGIWIFLRPNQKSETQIKPAKGMTEPPAPKMPSASEIANEVAKKFPKTSPMHKSSASMQLVKVHMLTPRLAPGLQISLNIYLANMGAEPAEDVHRFLAVDLISVQNPVETDIAAHAKFLEEALKDRREWEPKSKGKGTTVGIRESIFNTAILAPLSQQQYDGILKGNVRLYVYAWATWKDRVKNLDICTWMQAPQTEEITDSKIVWHDCARY